jgi:hypothetical protein
MPLLNPTDSWLPLEERYRAEKDPLVHRLIKEVRYHVEHEIAGDLEALMDTLTADPIYHFWGGAAPMVLMGRAQVRGFYQQMIAAGGNQFEIVLKRIVADAGSVITEGQVKQVYTGKELIAMGRTSFSDAPVAHAELFLTTTQLITVWPSDPDGKLVGEDIYFGEQPLSHMEKITPADLPRGYRWEHRV